MSPSPDRPQESRHPSDETLAAFLDGKLPSEERSTVVAHLASCAMCREVVGDAAAFAESEAAPAGAQVVQHPRWRVPAFAAAAVVALAVIGAGLLYRQRVSDPLRSMRSVAATLDARPIEARLAGFAWRPAPRITRGPRDSNPKTLRLQGEAGEVLERAGPHTDADALHARGVAHLLIGEVDAGLAELERAAAGKGEGCGPADDECRATAARYWNDVAAGRWQKATTYALPLEFARAADAAERALNLDANLADAQFNLGLARESLGLTQPAAAAYRRYLELDGASPWAQEVRSRLKPLETPPNTQLWPTEMRRLEAAVERGDNIEVVAIVKRFPQEARTWGEGEFLARWADAHLGGNRNAAAHNLAVARAVGEALRVMSRESMLSDAVAAIDRSPDVKALARGHRIYKKGRLASSTFRSGEAELFLREAAADLRAGCSPFAAVAEAYAFGVREQRRDRSVYADVMSALNATPRKYVALRALLEWLAGSAPGDQHLADSGAHYDAASHLFEELGEADNASLMFSFAASVRGMLGDTKGAWRARREAFRPASNETLFRHLLAAAASAAAEEQWEAARALLASCSVIPLKADNPNRFRAVFYDALVTTKLHQSPAKQLDLLNALTRDYSDPVIRRNYEDDATFARAFALKDSQPAKALELWSSCERYARTVGKVDRHVQLQRLRAATLTALGRPADAEADLREAIAAIERLSFVSNPDPLRDRLFGPSDGAYQELVDLYASERRWSDALAVAERYRSRLLPAGTGQDPSTPPIDIVALQRTIAPDEAIVSITQTAGSLVVVVATTNAIEGHRLPFGGPVAQTADFLAALQSGDSSARQLGAAIYGQLFGPLPSIERARRLTIVSSAGTMSMIPFGALVDSSGRYVVHSHVVTVAPSAMVSSGSHRAAGPAAAVVISDPAFDLQRFRMSRLAGAREEARVVTSFLPNARVLEGEQATRSVVLAELSRASILHVGAHALVSGASPEKSFVLLTPHDGDDGLLTAADVIRHGVRPGALTYLSACSTAGSAANGPEAARSLATAFLVAGSSDVVGSLWDVDDRASARFAESFYRAYSTGRTAEDAVREAQLNLIETSAGGVTGHAWAAFQHFGRRQWRRERG